MIAFWYPRKGKLVIKRRNKYMQTAINLINKIGTLGGIIGLAVLAISFLLFMLGLSSQDNMRMQGGTIGMVAGGAFGAVWKLIFTAIAAMLGGIG